MLRVVLFITTAAAFAFPYASNTYAQIQKGWDEKEEVFAGSGSTRFVGPDRNEYDSHQTDVRMGCSPEKPSRRNERGFCVAATSSSPPHDADRSCGNRFVVMQNNNREEWSNELELWSDFPECGGRRLRSGVEMTCGDWRGRSSTRSFVLWKGDGRQAMFQRLCRP